MRIGGRSRNEDLILLLFWRLGTRTFIEAQLESMRANAIIATILSVSNDLPNVIVSHTDPTLAWAALKSIYQASDQAQILMLTNKLQPIRLLERGSIKDYLKQARELRNQLSCIGEIISYKSII